MKNKTITVYSPKEQRQRDLNRELLSTLTPLVKEPFSLYQEGYDHFSIYFIPESEQSVLDLSNLLDSFNATDIEFPFTYSKFVCIDFKTDKMTYN